MASSTATEKNIAEILCSLRRGNCCRVLGPRRTAKSELMRRAATALKADEMHYVAYISLNAIPPAGPEQLYKQLYTAARHALPKRVNVPVAPDEITSAADFQHFLTEVVRAGDRNLAIFVDDFEIAPPNLAATVLGVFRAIYMTLIDQPGPRFQAVVCSSVAFSRLALKSASPFEGISDLVRVGDLDKMERHNFARTLCRGAGYTPMMSGLNLLFEYIGGDRVLIKSVLRICFEQMAREGRVRVTDGCITRAVEKFMRRPPPHHVVESMRQIEGDSNLLTCALIILEHEGIYSHRLPLKSEDVPSPLDLCGLFREEDGWYAVKSILWSNLLYQRLTPARIGGIYGVTADWGKAIEYLGIAVRYGGADIQARLFTTTINAIYASDDLVGIFRYLGRGLEAAFPHADVILYGHTDRALEPLYVSVTSSSPGAIPLRDAQSAEINALHGPDYSVTVVNGVTRWLMPLRRNGRTGQPVGLVSLHLPDLSGTPFRQREELLQLFEFLAHAGQAIERRQRYVQMLTAAEERTEELNSLNHILKRILDNQNRSEELILRMMMIGITAQSGLAFSRAVLFVFDAERKQLDGYLGIGSLSHSEAKRARERFPVPAIDAQLDALVREGIERTPMQDVISSMNIPAEPMHDNLFAQVLESGIVVNKMHRVLAAPFPSTFREGLQPPDEFIALPLRSGDRRLGVLYVDDKFTTASLNPERIELLQTFASQASLFVENIQILDDLNRTREQEHRERIAKVATGLIHDIRNAVANIPDLVTEIEENFQAGEDIHAPLQDLRDHAMEVDRIGRKLRDFIFTGKFSPKRFIVNELIRRAVRSVDDQRPDHVTINLFPPADGADIEAYADELWIELLLKNLLLNACQAAKPREGGVVSVTAEQHGDLLSLRVQDNGLGIPSENIDLIFEPGFTTKIDHGRSLGIGLYHCQLIAKTHGGEITVVSKPGIGTAFEVTFPIGS